MQGLAWHVHNLAACLSVGARKGHAVLTRGLWLRYRYRRQRPVLLWGYQHRWVSKDVTCNQSMMIIISEWYAASLHTCILLHLHPLACIKIKIMKSWTRLIDHKPQVPYHSSAVLPVSQEHTKAWYASISTYRNCDRELQSTRSSR